MPGPSIPTMFDEIYNATHKAALAFITAKCARTADIADIFQDTYVELYQVLQKRGTGYITNHKAFVLRLARQKLARYYSLQQRLKMFVSARAADEDGEEIDLHGFEADAFLTEDFVVNRVMLEAAREYVHTRPEAVQKVFYMFYDMGQTIPEIAKALAITESDVKNKLYRTIKELRKLLT